ncbi:FecR family protein [Fibrella aquatilis]|uniref:FecR domain-containing protein n=1 Tax=Fibrella aquatilis TaxID=2817059 RepID=A0A939G4G4_9BACT|nr:FecR domain-containing protein [Fibrella aquatilis]MBO0931924.1 FecR domain-containing protein [Fibrella aquatilis]
MDFENYSAIDLALDEGFKQWVQSPTPEATLFWTQFLQQHPHQEEAVLEARLLVEQLSVASEVASPERLELLWGRIQTELQTTVATKRNSTPDVMLLKSTWFMPIRRAAIWVGLLLGGGGLAYYHFGYAPTIQYETAYGETKTLTLPDGSVVTLNGHSKLTLQADWTGQPTRDVWLAGEAFFAVKKQKSNGGQPVKFRVLTPGMRIDVLGTRFNVNSRRRETVVALEEGQIQVWSESTAHQSTAKHPVALMQPGDVLSYSEASQHLVNQQANLTTLASWRDKRLIFNDTPIGEIVQALSDSYGIEVEYQRQGIANKRFSGSVQTDSVAVFFKKLEKIYGVTVLQTANRFIIR